MSDAGAQERKQKDDAVRTTIMQKLVETGEKERLKELLRQKLIECGWRDELKEYCKEVIRSKGLEKITVDELVAEITPRGRGAFLVCCATRDARPRSDGARRGQNRTSTEHPKIPPGHVDKEHFASPFYSGCIQANHGLFSQSSVPSPSSPPPDACCWPVFENGGFIT
mmetsp:Transcript_1949/g.4499  ORF Transcript_1949/g.4499 Transcript_1949/m.4499 type:complete len:168 (-) Transcript_1949:20-523(-)